MADFAGNGTPKVCLYDNQDNLVLDFISTNKNRYGIALTHFNLKFSEREEDEGIITMVSDSVGFLNDSYLLRGLNVKVSWGYIDDMRPAVKMVIVDTIERYGTDGYELTLKLSDTLAALTRNKNTLSVDLAEAAIAMEKVRDENIALTADAFYKKKYPMASARYDAFIRDRKLLKGYLDNKLTTKTYENTPSVNTELFSHNTGFFRPFDDLIEPWEIYTPASLKTALPKVPDSITRETWIKYELDYSPYTSRDGRVKMRRLLKYVTGAIGELKKSQEKAVAGVFHKAEAGKHITHINGSMQSILQQVIDQASEIPRQVTCHDGQVLIYNKKRYHEAPPVSTYEFKGGNGFLLDFTYDSNSTYNDDDCALSNIKMDPVTGALQDQTYANTIRKFTAESFEEDMGIALNQKIFSDIIDMVKGGMGMGAALEKAALTHMNLDKIEAYLKTQGGYHPPMAQFPIFVSGTVPGEELDKYQGVKPKPSLWTIFENSQVEMGAGPLIHGLAGKPLNDFTPHNKDMEVTAYLNATYDQLDDFRENLLNAVKNGSTEIVKATCRVIGDPHLISGDSLEFKGLSNKRNGKYFLTSCNHTINESGFIINTEMYRIADIPGGTVLTFKDKDRDKLKEDHKKLKYTKSGS